ncbi:MAG: DUF3106 domain-containing protein [Zoogloeaceae bacterium]|jgi:hypothetical protein|nr:DUF3106 domain-containing protein [Zoogloeaceae bacterium]
MDLRAPVAGLILACALLSPAQAVVPELRQPAWAELDAQQKQTLAPLAREWDKMDASRKKKWLGIARRYPAMAPEAQTRVQQRMQNWASLTPEQRAQARARYKDLKAAPPERKAALREKWRQYNELPEEEKRQLAQKRLPKMQPLIALPALPRQAPATVVADAPPPQTPSAAGAGEEKKQVAKKTGRKRSSRPQSLMATLPVLPRQLPAASLATGAPPAQIPTGAENGAVSGAHP